MNKMPKAVLPILLALVLLVTGCLAGSASSSRTNPIAPGKDTRVGSLAPDFQLSNLEGQSISLSDFRGSPVLINLWATWCPSCRDEMPYLQQIYDEWSGKGLVLLAIDMGESPSTVKEFMQSYNLSFPVLLDTNQDVALEYNIRYIPTTFLIDEDGIIQVVKVGAFSSTAEIEKNLSKIIP
ncbi:peroxiredoxin family protein [Chloroflexota bacterium]